MKAELRQILDEFQIVAAEYQMEVLRRLQKLMPPAQNLVEETRGKELGQILTTVATRVTSLRKPKAVEPVYQRTRDTKLAELLTEAEAKLG